MKMPTFGVDLLANCQVRFPLPLIGDHVVRGNFLQRPEHVSEGLGGRFFKRQDLDEIAVNPQVVPVAFELRIAGEIVEMVVVSEPRVELVGREVQKPAKEREGGKFIEALETE